MLTRMILAASRQGIVTSNLRLHLDAGDLASYSGSGTTWTDIGPNALNGTLTNGPTYDSNNRGSIVFDGSNDYVTCGTSTTLDFTGAYSAEAWIYATGWGGGGLGRVVDRRNSATTAGWLLFVEQASTSMKFGNNASSFIGGVSNSVALNEWAHFAGTFDGVTARLYKNGAEISNGSIAAAATAGSSICYVGNRADNTRSFAGRIASVALYARALSDAEVAKNFNAKRGRYGL